VHEVIRRWISPQDPALEDLLKTLALREGLVDDDQRGRAVREAEALLLRFWNLPLRKEIEQAEGRYHELPYTRRRAEGGMDTGAIDLLYLHQGRWKLVDFKTDEIEDEQTLKQAVERYHPQLGRYAEAVRDLLKTPVSLEICFLNAFERGHVVQIPSPAEEGTTHF
jgi:ATP-dependent exoDNAse (exonuclease V) beta subunit